MKHYEGLFILAAPIDEQTLDDRLDKIRAEIVKLGGTADRITRLGRQGFARRLKKKDSGFYVLVTFALDPSRLAALQERIRFLEEIVRAQITVAPRREPPAAGAAPESPKGATPA